MQTVNDLLERELRRCSEEGGRQGGMTALYIEGGICPYSTKQVIGLRAKLSSVLTWGVPEEKVMKFIRYMNEYCNQGRINQNENTAGLAIIEEIVSLSTPPAHLDILADLKFKILQYVQEIAQHFNVTPPHTYESITAGYLEDMLGSGHSNIRVIVTIQHHEKLRLLSATDLNIQMGWLSDYRGFCPRSYVSLNEAVMAVYSALNAQLSDVTTAPVMPVSFFQPVATPSVESTGLSVNVRSSK